MNLLTANKKAQHGTAGQFRKLRRASRGNQNVIQLFEYENQY